MQEASFDRPLPAALAPVVAARAPQRQNAYTNSKPYKQSKVLSQQHLCPVGMTEECRKEGWLFFGSPAGGSAVAVLYTLTATCRRLRIDPYA